MWVKRSMYEALVDRLDKVVEKVNSIDDDLRQDTKEVPRRSSIFGLFYGTDTEPTIRSEVDAILEHLNLEVSVKAATEQKVVAKDKSVKKASK